MHFYDVNKEVKTINHDNHVVEVGNYETANKNGSCVWIDDKMCIDLDTLKVIYKSK